MSEIVTVREAAAAGLTWDALQSRNWQRLVCGVYGPRAAHSAEARLEAIARRLPPEAVFSGRTAAYLHGQDFDPFDPVEVTVPAGHSAAHRAGVLFHKARLHPWEVDMRHWLRVTSRLRTMSDLGGGRDLVEAVVALDMALHTELVTEGELLQLAAGAVGKGSARLRRAVGLVAPAAESPMETRLRLILVLAHLPSPEVQAVLYDKTGQPFGRADLFYPERRLVIEYDGGTHRQSLTEDNRRQNRLVDAGYTILRFTAADMRNPARIVALVRAALYPPRRRISPEIRQFRS